VEDEDAAEVVWEDSFIFVLDSSDEASLILVLDSSDEASLVFVEDSLVEDSTETVLLTPATMGVGAGVENVDVTLGTSPRALQRLEMA